ncbi:hypothetical protein QP868_02295 [Brevibacterium sp. UMB1308A]|uniref:hypothetical protein n=1 Tax=Brevibacterium sp. UMB1308A TaxID=3050608 RepID=UPI0025504D4C|nr:hypothetical protein [Brevibacterium sp. UMB1308A]MDK8345424.1 hypothetical protein [Brevibacterium sp. UMB1308B]MDK8712729.1 hypothetical protein [Brevibacterium sp. UMB1308A]
MALVGVPWAIGGGADNPVEGARMSTFGATGGARGVLGATDMRVTALPVPGTAVRVHMGGGVTPNDYLPAPAYGSQSYVVREESSTDVPVPATGSAGGATRYLIVRITDPQYGGQAPSNVEDGPYNDYALVSKLTGLGYPFIPLAKITQPASTGTITNSMITDIREVANPRVEDHVIARPVVQQAIQDWSHVLRQKRKGTGVLRGEQFPDRVHGGGFKIKAPEWATRMIIECYLTGVRYSGKSSWGGWYIAHEAADGSGEPHWSQDFGWDVLENNTIYKTNWIMSENLYVWPDERGKEIQFDVRAFVDLASTAQTGQVSLDNRSGITFKCRFLEIADAPLES